MSSRRLRSATTDLPDADASIAYRKLWPGRGNWRVDDGDRSTRFPHAPFDFPSSIRWFGRLLGRVNERYRAFSITAYHATRGCPPRSFRVAVLAPRETRTEIRPAIRVFRNRERAPVREESRSRRGDDARYRTRVVSTRGRSIASSRRVPIVAAGRVGTRRRRKS